MRRESCERTCVARRPEIFCYRASHVTPLDWYGSGTVRFVRTEPREKRVLHFTPPRLKTHLHAHFNNGYISITLIFLTFSRYLHLSSGFENVKAQRHALMAEPLRRSSTPSNCKLTVSCASAAAMRARATRVEAASTDVRTTQPTALPKPSDGKTAVGSHELQTAPATIHEAASAAASVGHCAAPSTAINAEEYAATTSPRMSTGASTLGGQVGGGRLHHGLALSSSSLSLPIASRGFLHRGFSHNDVQ